MSDVALIPDRPSRRNHFIPPVKRFAEACPALAFACLLGLPLSAPALTIVTNGQALCPIIIPADALPTEKTAARQLQEHLRLISGAAFEIKTDAQVPVQDAQILIGRSPRIETLLGRTNWSALKHDGILIRTLGNKLILSGGRPRGTLYSIYTLLEDTLGVRWWTSTETTIPRTNTLDLPDLDITYTPSLLYRETYNADPIQNPLFATRLKVNGHMSSIPPDLGGHYNILGWCHTSYALLPPAQFFGPHPEWYSFRGTRRNPEGGQLCWSNPGMQKELARQALKWIEKNPQAGIISISQNDCLGNCECETCLRIDRQAGSPAGSLLTGINAVAAVIAENYPDFLVETLAYQYTRRPPGNITPARNVLVRLCSIECNFAQPLSAPANRSFGDDLRGWKAIAQNLFIWNYVTSFANYLIPQPNLDSLGADLQFFTDHNVVGVFEQGDAFNLLAGDFLPLRAWLQAHLMWDPSRNQTELRDRFLNGYFGPASPFLREYLDLVNAPAKKPGLTAGCYNNNLSFLSDEAIARAVALFAQAATAVAAHPDLARRVRRERLVIDHVQLLRQNFAGQLATHPRSPCAEYESRADQFKNAALELGVKHYSEGQDFGSYAAGLKSRCERAVPPQLPNPSGNLPSGQFDVQEHLFTLHGTWAKLVDDPKASNGRGAAMSGDHTQWAVQFPITPDSVFAGPGPWKCYVVARVDPVAKSGPAFRYGVYDSRNNGSVAQEGAELAVAGDGEYHPYGVVVDHLAPGMYFWVAPPGSTQQITRVYVDRILIRKSTE